MKPQLIEPTGCEAQQTSKGVNKAALLNVEQTATLHSFVLHVSPNRFTGWLFIHILTPFAFCAGLWPQNEG